MSAGKKICTRICLTLRNCAGAELTGDTRGPAGRSGQCKEEQVQSQEKRGRGTATTRAQHGPCSLFICANVHATHPQIFTQPIIDSNPVHSVMVYKGQLIRDTRQNLAMGHGTTSTTTPRTMGQAYSWHHWDTRQNF